MVELRTLQEQVLEGNLALSRRGLALGTWGNASVIDRTYGIVVIKPSGVTYETMRAEHMVAVDLDGKTVEGSLRPSSDTATHLVLYKAFPGIGAVTHTHSHYATCWAQACKAIPCLGTTHADHFYGDVPVTEPLTASEIAEHYERNTGEVIVRRFAKLDPLHFPGVLVANHAPFTWGETIEKAVENADILEEIARMALHTLMISPSQSAIDQTLLGKHFLRKHGAGAYYGQSTEKP